MIELHRRGAFGWSEWVAALAGEIEARPAQAGEDAADAWHRQWLAALETLLDTKGIARRAEIAARADAWRRAYEATPHGEPVLLARAACAPAAGHAHDHDHGHGHDHDHPAPRRPIAVSFKGFPPRA